jgi:hypothetical protein
MAKRLEEIASADDGEIGGELLDWSGLSKIWNEHSLAGDYDFLRDVAEHCGSIDISTEQWGGDAPGLSGETVGATPSRCVTSAAETV